LSGSDIQKGCLSAREEEDKTIVSATLSAAHLQEIDKQTNNKKKMMNNTWKGDKKEKCSKQTGR